jgi:hypothetical protein
MAGLVMNHAGVRVGAVGAMVQLTQENADGVIGGQSQLSPRFARDVARALAVAADEAEREQMKTDAELERVNRGRAEPESTGQRRTF